MAEQPHNLVVDDEANQPNGVKQEVDEGSNLFDELMEIANMNSHQVEESRPEDRQEVDVSNEIESTNYGNDMGTEMKDSSSANNAPISSQSEDGTITADAVKGEIPKTVQENETLPVCQQDGQFQSCVNEDSDKTSRDSLGTSICDPNTMQSSSQQFESEISVQKDKKLGSLLVEESSKENDTTNCKETGEVTIGDSNSEEQESGQPGEVYKRLSKAVDDLSDLEKQLCSIMTLLPTETEEQGDVVVVSTDSTVESCQGDKDNTIEPINHTEPELDKEQSFGELVRPGEQILADGKCTDYNSDVSTNANNELVPGNNVEDSIAGKDWETSRGEQHLLGEKSLEISSNPVEVESDAFTQHGSGEDVNDGIEMPAATDIIKISPETSENLVNEDVVNSSDLSLETVLEDNTVAEEPVERSESSDDPDKELDDIHASVPDIEIMMTDESGISEHKSLDSLDTDLDEISHSQPDSPVLTDEGIDSDSKSDTMEDDEAFNENDIAMKSKSWYLEVDRDRMGSDSSTFSEIEFKEGLAKTTDDKKGALGGDLIRGHLFKMGGSGLTPKNWRKRWFVLKEDNCLYYYKHSTDRCPCGVIVLCNYSVSKAPESRKGHCFKLDKGGARSFLLCAASEADMKKWMLALMQATAYISKLGAGFQILEGSVHNVSIPALSIRDPDCHGYLSKKGHNFKKWKRRYCVLKNGYLYYYSDMANTRALGVARLLEYTLQLGETKGRHFTFFAEAPDSSMRKYHFSAETETDRKRWMSKMEDSIQRGST